MESIRQAVELARAQQSALKSPEMEKPSRRRIERSSTTDREVGVVDAELDPTQLIAKRIVAHDGADQRTRPYDILRTQVLRTMAMSGWRIVGVTSPTPGCGKTVTAVNLAFSFARQPDHSVVLVDLDLQKPQVGFCLGLGTPEDHGVLGLLRQKTTIRDASISVRAGQQRMTVLPTAATKESSELMSSRAMRQLLHDIKRDDQSQLVIVDLPPVLSTDDVIAVLPEIDCILLVTAVGETTTTQLEDCIRHLHSSHIVRVVINKANEASGDYYGYY